MNIELLNGFFIECTSKSYILKERYEGKTKDGNPREGTRRHGSHYDLQSALHQFLRLNTLNGAQAVEIWEVGKMIEQSNKTTVNRLEQIWRGENESIHKRTDAGT